MKFPVSRLIPNLVLFVAAALLVAACGTIDEAAAAKEASWSQRVFFEGLDCAQDRKQVFRAALAAAKAAGYEPQAVDDTTFTFRGRSNRQQERIGLSVEVTCTGPPPLGRNSQVSSAFHGPKGVAVDARLTTGQGSLWAAQHDFGVFRVQLRRRVQSKPALTTCLGLVVQEVEALEPVDQRRLGVSSGLLVREVRPGGPGAAAGLAPGDVIVFIDERALSNAADLRESLRDKQPGDRISLLVNRHGASIASQLTLGRAQVEGGCASVGIQSEPESVAPPPAPEQSLVIETMAVRPSQVAPGEAFEVDLVISAHSGNTEQGTAEVVLTFEILREGKRLFRSSSETISCVNGGSTEVSKRLKAGRAPGVYELRASVEGLSVQHRLSRPFEIADSEP